MCISLHCCIVDMAMEKEKKMSKALAKNLVLVLSHLAIAAYCLTRLLNQQITMAILYLLINYLFGKFF